MAGVKSWRVENTPRIQKIWRGEEGEPKLLTNMAMAGVVSLGL